MARPKGTKTATTEPKGKVHAIEKGVPIPQQHSGYLHDAMKKLAAGDIGDSMFIEAREGSHIGQACRRVGNNKWFVTRTTEKDGARGTRVWKVAGPLKT